MVIQFLRPAFPGQMVADLPFSVLITVCPVLSNCSRHRKVPFHFETLMRIASWQKDTFPRIRSKGLLLVLNFEFAQ
jgi:hypothetical protein